MHSCHCYINGTTIYNPRLAPHRFIVLQ